MKPHLQSKNYQDLPIFIQWLDFLKWLLLTIEKFPKKVRFTVSNRIAVIALDVAENLTEARYTSEKGPILKKLNIQIEKLRILIRISYETQLLSYKAYEHAAKSLNETGKMLGGWM